MLSCPITSLPELSSVLIKQGAMHALALVAGCETMAQAPLMPRPPSSWEGRGSITGGASIRRSSMEPILDVSASFNSRPARPGSRRVTEQDVDVEPLSQLVLRSSGSIRRSSLVDMHLNSLSVSHRTTEVDRMEDIRQSTSLRRSSVIEMGPGMALSRGGSRRVTEQEPDLGPPGKLPSPGNSGMLSKLSGAQPRSLNRRASSEPIREIPSALRRAAEVRTQNHCACS